MAGTGVISEGRFGTAGVAAGVGSAAAAGSVPSTMTIGDATVIPAAAGLPALDELPGFRRRFRVLPEPDRIVTEVEDDYHHMRVVVRHEAGVMVDVASTMLRAPWTTCPGAPAVIRQTFTGVRLDQAVARGGKAANCTHLYDLVLLAAAHADDAGPSDYLMLVSDPVDEVVRAELRRNGRPVLGWTLHGRQLVEPAPVAGLGLQELGPWIATLAPERQEHARLLRWGSILAHGRMKSMEGRAKAADLPLGQCYTFQPEMAAQARYIEGTVVDFSRGPRAPLPGKGTGSGRSRTEVVMKAAV